MAQFLVNLLIFFSAPLMVSVFFRLLVWLLERLIPAWRRVPPPDPEALAAKPSAGRGGEFAAGVAISALANQHAQIDALDTKLAFASAASVTVLSIVAAGSFVLNRSEVSEGEVWLVGCSVVALVLAFVHGFWGMRVRKWQGAPDPDATRALFRNPSYRTEQVFWSVTTALEAAYKRNGDLLEPKAASFRVAWSLLGVGLLFGLIAAFFHFSG